MTGIPLSTCYRYVAELVQIGFLAPSRTRADSLTIGTTLTELLAGSDPHRHLRRVARPYLVDLQRVTGHHTQLAVLEGNQIVYVEKLSATRAVPSITDVGRRMPAVVNSSGVLLLAEQGIHQVETALDADAIERFRTGLPDFAVVPTPTPESLRAQALEARRKGYCELDSWLAPGSPLRSAMQRGRRSRQCRSSCRATQPRSGG